MEGVVARPTDPSVYRPRGTAGPYVEYVRNTLLRRVPVVLAEGGHVMLLDLASLRVGSRAGHFFSYFQSFE